MGRRHTPRRKTKLDKFQCILMLVFGLTIGTIFTIGMSYWNAGIIQEEAIAVTAEYQGYEVFHPHSRTGAARRDISTVDLHFSNHETLSIDGSCAATDLLSSLDGIRHGTVLELLIHPNSDTILAIHAGGRALLSFEDAINRLSFERWGFFAIGILCYLCAGIGAYYLITRKYRKYY